MAGLGVANSAGERANGAGNSGGVLPASITASYLVSVAAKREAHGDRKFIDVSEPIALA